MHSFRGFRRLLLGLGLALAFSPAAEPSQRKEESRTMDGIQAVGHVALKADSASQMQVARQGRRSYLYIELSSRPVLLQVDVTRPSKPRLLSELPLASKSETHMDTVVGDAILVTDVPETNSEQTVPHTVRLLNFADPGHPKTVREFANVTGFLKDEGRGLIYLFNDTGLWILEQKPSPDADAMERYAREVLYNH